MTSPDDLLTTHEAGAIPPFSYWTLVAWRREGRGPVYHRIGKKIMYRRADLMDFIQRGRVQPGNGTHDEK